MASMSEGTAACAIIWETGKAVASEPIGGCDDKTLTQMITKADAVGIDAPFGWPIAFAEKVGAWNFELWDSKMRERLCFRETDRVVRDEVKRWPLSVSADRIALPAMRTVGLLIRHGVSDRSGDGKFYEVYPAASLKCWDLNNRGYKKDTQDGEPARRNILRGLCEKMPWLVAPESCAATSHGLDALIASLTVRAAIQNRTVQPSPRTSFQCKARGMDSPANRPPKSVKHSLRSSC
jgi:predicted nuclease with RNAse H fold